jgi:Fur family transcriptional regulator, peroxide stress response regulator
MAFKNIRNILTEKGLKVTPQRVVVLDTLLKLNNHPAADQVTEYIRKKHPNIATGTIYKILETFVVYGIVHKVKTERDVMRYDAILESHHHLYCSESDRIEDYFDNDLNKLLRDYFNRKNIPGFKIEDIKLQIKGKFN